MLTIQTQKQVGYVCCLRSEAINTYWSQQSSTFFLAVCADKSQVFDCKLSVQFKLLLAFFYCSRISYDLWFILKTSANNQASVILHRQR